MPHSSDLGAGDQKGLKTQYNNLRADVVNVTTGHAHSGAAEDGTKVISLITIPILFIDQTNAPHSAANAGIWEEIGADQSETFLVRFTIDCARFGPNVSTVLHAVFKGGEADPQYVELRLYNVTNAAGYTAIQRVGGTSYAYARSAAFTLPSTGTKTFTLQGKTSSQPGGVVCQVCQAWLELYSS